MILIRKQFKLDAAIHRSWHDEKFNFVRDTEPTWHEGQLCVCVFSVVVREANNVRV